MTGSIFCHRYWLIKIQVKDAHSHDLKKSSRTVQAKHVANVQGRHAAVHGFRNHEYEATILFVIDPKADKPTTRIQAFADLEEGADYLKWKRSRWPSGYSRNFLRLKSNVPEGHQ